MLSPIVNFSAERLHDKVIVSCCLDRNNAIFANLCARTLLTVKGNGISKNICSSSSAKNSDAVPEPDPAPVAVKFMPTVFAEAPIAVKLVVPTVNILYVCPETKSPAVVFDNCAG